MFEDQEVLRELFEARVPVELRLAPEDFTSTSTDALRPYYVLLPRVSYLPAVSDRIARYFQPFVGHFGDEGVEMWFSSDGVPLRWNYPIGVLSDIFYFGKSQDDTVPWSITVHFKNFPEDELLHCRRKEVAEANFMQMLKEADQLKHRGQAMQAMQKRDHNQLWNGLCNDRFEQFWSVNRKMMSNSEDDEIRFVPFRLYTVNRSEDEERTLKKFAFLQSSELVPLQKPLPHKDEDGTQLTLQHAIHRLAPQLLENGSVNFVSHGIVLQLDTPLLWLCVNFAYPDNFVHVCAIHSA